MMHSIKDGENIAITDDALKPTTKEKGLIDHPIEKSFDQQYKDYGMELKNFRIFQLEKLFDNISYDTSYNRRLKTKPKEIISKMRDEENIDIAVLKIDSNEAGYRSESEKIENREIIRHVEKILTSGVPKGDNLSGYIPPVRHLLSKDQEITAKLLAHGDKKALRPLRIFLLEKQYDIFLNKAMQAKTEEEREVMYKHINDLSVRNADLWPEFYVLLEKHAWRENSSDRFDYYDPTYERAEVLTNKEILDMHEEDELNTKVDLLVWTMIRKAERSGQGISVYLGNEIQKLSKRLELKNERFNNALWVQRLRAEIAKDEQKREKEREDRKGKRVEEGRML